MDITTIDAVSFATRVGQAAASELFVLLATDDDFPVPIYGWFNPPKYMAKASGGELADQMADLNNAIEALGQYVCLNQVDQGERLFRWGRLHGIVPGGDWTTLDVAGRQAFEAFVDTTRHTYLGLAVAQQALANARAAAGVATTLKREDSIFEETDSLGTLRPEAIEAGPLLERYRREQESAAQVAAAEKLAQEEAARKAEEAARAEKPSRRPRSPKPEPVSAGETVAKAAVNRGGRGNKKPAA